MTAGLLATLAALAESACAAVAGSLQHEAASRGRTTTSTATSQVLGFVLHQLRQRLWWIAAFVQAGSLLLHATALGLGSLSLVQPIQASVVVLALPLSHRMNRSRSSRPELFWAGLVAVSLAGFLVVASPRPASGRLRATELAVPAAIAVCAVTACIVVARWGPSHVAASALGTASGIAFSFEAALLQVATHQLLARGPSAALLAPGVYGLVVAGLAGVALTQLAYRAGPMSAALPAIITVNPVASVLLGVLVGGEQIRTSPAAVAGEVASFACLALAVATLSRFPGAVPVDSVAPAGRRPTRMSARPSRQHRTSIGRSAQRLAAKASAAAVAGEPAQAAVPRVARGPTTPPHSSPHPS